MRLRKLSLRDIGPFDQLELDLPEGQRADRADVHLLIGPNGTGKTTILQALAQLFTPAPTGLVGRIRSERSVAIVEHRAAEKLIWKPGLASEITLDEATYRRFSTVTPEHYGSAKGLVFHLQPLAGDAFFARTPRFRNAHALLFAYGGQRRAPGVGLPGIQPLTDNPLAEAALFDKPTSEGAFVQWLANLVAQQALAEKHKDPRAETLAATLQRVASALAEVTGGTVAFDLRQDLLGVNVVLDGHPVPHGQLPAGLGALLAWVGDLLMRLDRLPWEGDLPISEREFVLLLDEVEVHLHPAWQRQVLIMAERLFPKAQIIAATHSPFVIQSASDAWVHRLELRGGRAYLAGSERGPFGASYTAVVRDLMGVQVEFSVDIEEQWRTFRALKTGVLTG
jgi:predicted ATP-binding protein involved in virulence